MRAYSQFPPPDFHRLDTRPYGLRTNDTNYSNDGFQVRHPVSPFVSFATFVPFVICLRYRRSKDHVVGHIAPARSLITQDGQNHE